MDYISNFSRLILLMVSFQLGAMEKTRHVAHLNRLHSDVQLLIIQQVINAAGGRTDAFSTCKSLRLTNKSFARLFKQNMGFLIEAFSRYYPLSTNKALALLKETHWWGCNTSKWADEFFKNQSARAILYDVLPIMIAGQFFDEYMVSLKRLGVTFDVFLKNNNDITPLMLAIGLRVPLHRISYIAFQTKQINAVDKKGNTALMRALSMASIPLFFRQASQIAWFLLSTFPEQDINRFNQEGKNALMIAREVEAARIAQGNRSEQEFDYVIERLLKMGSLTELPKVSKTSNHASIRFIEDYVGG